MFFRFSYKLRPSESGAAASGGAIPPPRTNPDPRFSCQLVGDRHVLSSTAAAYAAPIRVRPADRIRRRFVLLKCEGSRRATRQVRRVRSRGHGRTCTAGVISRSRFNWLDPMGPRFSDRKANVNPVVVYERQSVAAATADESPHTAPMSLRMLETLPNQRRIWHASQRV